MPIEYTLLKGEPEPFTGCPKCGVVPFRSMMRGQVQSGWRKFVGLPYCCVICDSCEQIVGMECPPKEKQR